MSTFVQKVDSDIQWIKPGADPGFFLEGGALASRSTSTPINHIVSFLAEYQLYQKTAGHLGGGAHPLHPPPRSAPENTIYFLNS